jgi:hypothetical protein
VTENLSLPAFIRKNLATITEEWQQFAETLATPGTSDLLIRNSIHQILFFIADDIETSQSAAQQTAKSQGQNDKRKDNPGVLHATERYDIGFNMVEMVSEYRALRATVIKLWTKAKPVMIYSDMVELIRFTEAIDQLLAESVICFMKNYQINQKI